VTSERRGQWIFYRLAPETAERLGTIARRLQERPGTVEAAGLIERLAGRPVRAAQR
jgi:DNA-binding transcriptional ArsR family regulator